MQLSSLKTSCFVLIAILGPAPVVMATCYGRDELEAAAAGYVGDADAGSLKGAVDALIDDGIYKAPGDVILQCHRVHAPMANDHEIRLTEACRELLGWARDGLPVDGFVRRTALQRWASDGHALERAVDAFKTEAMVYVVYLASGRITSDLAERALATGEK